MPRLSKRTVDAAQPQATRYFLWDDDIKGFGLLVLPTGVKSFVLQYRTAEGQSRRATIGKMGTLTPEQARRRAQEMALDVASGRDPLGERQEKRRALTIGDILDRYLESAWYAGKAPSTKAIEAGRIKRHLRPLLGKVHAHHLTGDRVRQALAAITEGKTATTERTGPRGLAVVKGGTTTARDAIALLRAILNWAVAEGLATDNPAKGVKLPPAGRREVFLEDGEQYAALFKALDKLETERAIRSEAADAIRLIAMTGARKSEITCARWRHVDLKAGVLTLPPAEHKSGRSTGKARVIHLPAPAMEIIARQAPGEPDAFVFRPARGNGGAMEIKRTWAKVREAAKLPATLGLHGLRHSVGASMAAAGAAAPEIGAQLGHSQLATVARYIHWARDSRRALAERAAAPAVAGMAKAKGEPAADVLPIKGRG